eukprot:GHUV01012070.1.p1 GENE.GHUV01012070.1~~GHUV01012070.1.p1  ORF type:complete len:226 (+),score=73.69 GHUV01012070.1:308-985(+)
MAEAAVLKLIQQHNKPFGVQGLVDNLQSAGIKKTAVQKACDALVDSGQIVCKEFGKTKLYMPKQEGLEVLPKEELDSKKAELKQLQEQLTAAHKAVKAAESELRSWQSSFTVEELRVRVAELSSTRDQQLNKLQGLRSGAKLVSPEERRTTEASFRQALDCWRKRRSVFRSIWDTISEGIEGKQADLFEEMGVDTDEAASVTYSLFEKLVPVGGAIKRSRGGKAA